MCTFIPASIECLGMNLLKSSKKHTGVAVLSGVKMASGLWLRTDFLQCTGYESLPPLVTCWSAV